MTFGVSKLRNTDVPCVSSCILNDSTGVVDVIKQLNLSRSEVDKASPLLLQSFDFSTLYTKIDLMEAYMKVLINKVFYQMLKLHCFKFLLVQKTALNCRFLCLKNKEEINLFEILHSFKVVEASDLIFWLDFLLDNLFLCFGRQCAYRQCIGIPMGTNCAVYLANFYLFSYEFDFLELLLKYNTCPVVLHRLSLVRRFVDDLFVPDFPDLENFMYLDQYFFGGSTYPKSSRKLNCTSKGFSCNFLNLAVKQSPQGISCDIFDKCSQPEIEMIHMPHVHSNIPITAKLGVINSQFCRFLRLCSCKEFFVSQMVSLIVLLKNKGYPLKILLNRTRGLLNIEKFLFGISAFGVFQTVLCIKSCKWGASCKPTWSLFLLSFSVCFSVFCYLIVLLFVASQ